MYIYLALTAFPPFYWCWYQWTQSVLILFKQVCTFPFNVQTLSCADTKQTLSGLGPALCIFTYKSVIQQLVWLSLTWAEIVGLPTYYKTVSKFKIFSFQVQFFRPGPLLKWVTKCAITTALVNIALGLQDQLVWLCRKIKDRKLAKLPINKLCMSKSHPWRQRKICISWTGICKNSFWKMNVWYIWT